MTVADGSAASAPAANESRPNVIASTPGFGDFAAIHGDMEDSCGTSVASSDDGRLVGERRPDAAGPCDAFVTVPFMAPRLEAFRCMLHSRVFPARSLPGR